MGDFCGLCNTKIAVGETAGGKYCEGYIVHVCKGCCAITDAAIMVDEGNSKRIPLYLVDQPTLSGTPHTSVPFQVRNWIGSLRLNVHSFKMRKHWMAGTRTDVWFFGPDGFVWWGVQYGSFTNIVHCRRTKEIWRKPMVLAPEND